MTPTVGVIANPRAGKDIRRIVAHAPAPSDTSRIADLRRVIVGAFEGGAERVLIANDSQALVERAAFGIEGNVEVLDVQATGTGDDSARAAAAMREQGVEVIAVYGGDGTHRDVCRGWRDAPIVAIAGGTNNAFAQDIEPTVAGAAAGLVAAGVAPLNELVAYQSLVIDIDIDGLPSDLALIDVAVIRNDTGGGAAVWSVDGIEQVLTAVAEPWSVGLSALAGLVAPTSRTDDRGVLLELGENAKQRLRAPVAPGYYVDAGLRSVSVVDAGQPVTVHGPATFSVDGERGLILASHERATLTIRRNGPRVIDIRRTFALAVRQGHFYTELPEGT